MPQTLIIIKGLHAGSRMIDPDETTYNEQIIETNIKSLDVFCKKLLMLSIDLKMLQISKKKLKKLNLNLKLTILQNLNSLTHFQNTM